MTLNDKLQISLVLIMDPTSIPNNISVKTYSALATIGPHYAIQQQQIIFC